MRIHKIIPTTLLSLTIFLSISQLAFGSDRKQNALDEADGAGAASAPVGTQRQPDHAQVLPDSRVLGEHSELPSKHPGVPIPRTISEESQSTVEFFNSMIVKSGEKIFGGFPERTDDLAAWKARFEKGEDDLKLMNSEVRESFTGTITPLKIKQTPTLDIIPANCKDKSKVVVYVHGGGFTTNSADTQLICCAPLASMSGLRIISVDYERAPFARYPQILNQVVQVFTGLVEDGYGMQDSAVYGDSAGGNIAVAAVTKMRDEGMGMPAADVLWFPWLDLTGSSDSYKTLEQHDPILSSDALAKCALAYAPLEEHRNPLVSPLFGDFTPGFPPTLIQTGTDMLRDDSIRFDQKLTEARQEVKLERYEGMWHDFQAFSPNLPESKTALQQTAKFLREKLRVEL